MRKYALRIGSAALAVAAGLAAAQASAQDAAAAANDGEIIIVTAQKRAQELIDVPQSVTVVSGAALEDQHADAFQDYLKLVPGLQLDQSRAGQGRLIVRGVNTDGVASTIGVYMDETPFGSSSGLVNAAVLAGDFDTFDLERIEVLRGPQGTFYGASSLSGVLKFVTVEPSTSGLEVRGPGRRRNDQGWRGERLRQSRGQRAAFRNGRVPRLGLLPQHRRVHRFRGRRRLRHRKEHQRQQVLRRPCLAAGQAERDDRPALHCGDPEP